MSFMTNCTSFTNSVVIILGPKTSKVIIIVKYRKIKDWFNIFYFLWLKCCFLSSREIALKPLIYMCGFLYLLIMHMCVYVYVESRGQCCLSSSNFLQINFGNNASNWSYNSLIWVDWGSVCLGFPSTGIKSMCTCIHHCIFVCLFD